MIRLVCLCTSCHRTTHFGHAQVTGHEQDALEHLCHVNGWTPPAGVGARRRRAAKWQRRSEHVWELDLSMLTDAGITVTPPPAAGERPAHAAAALDELTSRPGAASRPDRGERAPERDPGVAVRAVTVDEVGRGEDPMSRVLRGLPPFPDLTAARVPPAAPRAVLGPDCSSAVQVLRRRVTKGVPTTSPRNRLFTHLLLDLGTSLGVRRRCVA